MIGVLRGVVASGVALMGGVGDESTFPDYVIKILEMDHFGFPLHCIAAHCIPGDTSLGLSTGIQVGCATVDMEKQNLTLDCSLALLRGKHEDDGPGFHGCFNLPGRGLDLVDRCMFCSYSCRLRCF